MRRHRGRKAPDDRSLNRTFNPEAAVANAESLGANAHTLGPREIEIFLTLGEELHFGRTARRLHLTPARVSQVIQQLERRVGAPLFERTSRRVEMTLIGRQLDDALRPAYQQIHDAIEQAMRMARGVSGVLRVGFLSAGTSLFVFEVAEQFQIRRPDCEIMIGESRLGDGLEPLREGAVDILLAVMPVGADRAPDLTRGGVLAREGRMLAISHRHELSHRESVSFADLAEACVLRSPPALPAYWDDTAVPRVTADGKPPKRGPTFTTVQEMLALVGAGKGSYPVPAHASEYYPRPDVAYVPIDNAPIEWRLIWLTDAETDLIRAFDCIAADVAHATWTNLPTRRGATVGLPEASPDSA
jgi:DNA-binding transcriptional LysR family regulator